MNYEEYFSYDALGLAELVRTKKLSQSELLEIALNLTDILDPELNAIPIKHYELAREKAKLSTQSNNSLILFAFICLKLIFSQFCSKVIPQY